MLGNYYDAFLPFAASMLAGSGAILLIHLLRRRPLERTGPGLLILLYSLCALRLLMPLELGKKQNVFYVPFSIDTPELYNDSFYKFLAGKPTFSAAGRINAWSKYSDWDIIRWAWLGVAAALLLWFAIQYISSLRRILRDSRPAGLDARQALNQLRLEAGGPRVEAYVCPAVSVPMGVGILKKRLLLPREDYSPNELEYILRHEYTHFLHRDPLTKLLLQVFCCVFWWNPASYLLKSDMDQLLEVRVDRAVTKELGAQERLEYLSVLVELLKDIPRTRRHPLKIPVSAQAAREHSSMVERFRIVSAPNSSRSRRKRRILLMVQCLLAAICVGLTVWTCTVTVKPTFIHTDWSRAYGYNPNAPFPYGYVMRHTDGHYTAVDAYGREARITPQMAAYLGYSNTYGLVVEGFTDYLLEGTEHLYK